MGKNKRLSVLLIVVLSFSLSVFISYVLPNKVFGQVGSNMPDDATLLKQRQVEVSSGFLVDPPTQPLRPVERVERETFGDVGLAPLNTAAQLDRLLYPSVPQSARNRLVEGASFFTTPHTAAEGLGAMANQTRCAGCHLNNLESVPGEGLLTGTSSVSRAGRSTPTNFSITSGDTLNGGRPAGVRLDPVNPNGSVDLSIIQNDPAFDAVTNTGRTAAFTIFGDFSPSQDVISPTTSYDPLDGVANSSNFTTSSQNFGGFVQHTRPPIDELKAFNPTIICLPEAIPSIVQDKNLGKIDPITGLSASGFRRGVGERAGPPYIGRGLMEAIPTQDITGATDSFDVKGGNSSLKTNLFRCTGDCVTGAVNMIPANAAPNQANALASGVGRFGLRANGAEMLQFIIGGLQGELGLRSLINNNEINIADPNIASYNQNCRNPLVTGNPSIPEFRLSTPFSERNFLRLTAPPEFGPSLLAVLNSKDPSQPSNGNSHVVSVQRGAQLFGIDLTAFANRMIPGRMPSSGDGRDPNAINQSDRMVSCVSCHIPVQRTGRSPAYNDPSLGTDAAAVTNILSYRWAPIFSDLILHKGPTIDAERFAPTPRDPILVQRTTVVSNEQSSSNSGEDNDADDNQTQTFLTYDLARNLTDDIFSNQKATAKGEQFRTPPLMGIGKVGPPFLHDARVYLSIFNRDTRPAGTVFTNSKVTNAPLVVRSVDDAMRAAIELHDLPAPDDYKTSKLLGGGCPVPPGGKVMNKIGNVIDYGLSPAYVMCPPYTSSVSTTHRSEAREVIARFRSLTPSDQQAIIDFLKEL